MVGIIHLFIIMNINHFIIPLNNLAYYPHLKDFIVSISQN